MAKLSIVILSRNKRVNGSYPVELRIFHKGVHRYIDTFLSAREYELERERDLSGKYKDSVWKIKDRTLFRRADAVLRDYEDALLKLNIDSMTADEVKTRLLSFVNAGKLSNSGVNIVSFFDQRIVTLREQGRLGAADNARTVRNALVDYFKRPIIFSHEITSKELKKFYDYVQTPRIIIRVNQGKSKARETKAVNKTTAYNYIKELRTVFNAMIDEFNDEENDIIVIRNYPFKKLDLSQPPTKHRASPIDDICKLYKLYDSYKDLSKREKLGLDMFFLSYFTAGMNSVDIFNMQKTNLAKGRLSYNRSKTKEKRQDEAFISIAVRPEAMAIIDRYKADKGKSLFNFSENYADRRNFSKAINTGLASICKMLEINPVTHYVARHSWATIARNECNISLDDIRMSLNHSDKKNKVIDIYIAPDYSKVDNANNMVAEQLHEAMLEFAKKLQEPEENR